MLTVAFPVLGINLFSGSWVDSTLLTLFTAVVPVVAAFSYSLMEEPARKLVRDWSRRLGRQRTAM